MGHCGILTTVNKYLNGTINHNKLFKLLKYKKRQRRKIMKIGIIGSGAVGQALGKGFAGLGDDAMLGSRDPSSEKVKTWVKQTGKHASSGTFKEAAKFSDLAVLATSWSGTENAIKLAGPENLSGKIVIDVTNPLVAGKQGEPPSLALGHTDSGGEQVQRWLSKSKVVKAFNIVGNAHMVNPQFPGGPPDMFICGNDKGAKNKVTEILKAFGWNVIDIGGIEGSRELEPLCILWVKYAFISGGWNHAFKLLKK
jgi:predicted dinucleotide-binding enzyme